MQAKDTPLHVHIVDGDLVVRIGIARLDGHDNHPDFPDLPITDPLLWAADVAHELMRDRGDGATPICLCIDEAIKAAIENGSVGIDYKRPVRRDIDGEPCLANH